MGSDVQISDELCHVAGWTDPSTKAPASLLTIRRSGYRPQPTKRWGGLRHARMLQLEMDRAVVDRQPAITQAGVRVRECNRRLLLPCRRAARQSTWKQNEWQSRERGGKTWREKTIGMPQERRTLAGRATAGGGPCGPRGEGSP